MKKKKMRKSTPFATPLLIRPLCFLSMYHTPLISLRQYFAGAQWTSSAPKTALIIYDSAKHVDCCVITGPAKDSPWNRPLIVTPSIIMMLCETHSSQHSTEDPLSPPRSYDRFTNSPEFIPSFVRTTARVYDAWKVNGKASKESR